MWNWWTRFHCIRGFDPWLFFSFVSSQVRQTFFGTILESLKIEFIVCCNTAGKKVLTNLKTNRLISILNRIVTWKALLWHLFYDSLTVPSSSQVVFCAVLVLVTQYLVTCFGSRSCDRLLTPEKKDSSVFRPELFPTFTEVSTIWK